jgi:3-hydroxyacyl-CoA dehydrogenase / enoyl-CoA hydratase / 3-hydroxybutyryl-CoA epimerase
VSNIALSVGADGVAVALMDMPGRPFNVFSDAMIDDLAGVLDHTEADAGIRALVFASAKDAFMAGADLAMVRRFATMRRDHTPEQIRATFSRLGRLMLRLECLPKPTVAAVNGLALGGGLELALACRYRVMADRPDARLGVPEVKLGLLPGAGGTQRLPRMIDVEAAVKLLLTGEPVTPREALALGLVNALEPPAAVMTAAKAAALRDPQPPPWSAASWRKPLPDVMRGSRAEVIQRFMAIAGRSAAEVANYPALAAIADCVFDGLALDIEAGIGVEEACFLRLMLDPVAGNMIRTSFLNRTAAVKRAADRLGVKPIRPKRVALDSGLDGVARLLASAGIAAVAATEPFDLRVTGNADATGSTIRWNDAGGSAVGGARLCGAGALGSFEAVEVTVDPDLAGRCLGLLSALRLCPVVVDPLQGGMLGPCLGAARDWVARQRAAGHSVDRLAAAIAAVDAGPLARLLGLPEAEPDAARDLGLDFLHAVALAAQAALASGALASADDADLLAVFGLGFPAWTGGPIALLKDNAAA